MNEYYNFSNPLGVGLARSTVLNANFASIAAGFDLLPEASIITNGLVNYAEATGSSNAYAVALTPEVTAFVEGMLVQFKANHTNTGASTLAVDSMDVKQILDHNGDALTAGVIQEDAVVEVRYFDGAFRTNPVIVNTIPPENSVTNAILTNMAQATVKGRAAGAGTGDPQDLTATQLAAVLSGQVLTVGNASSGNHALNRTTADSRYVMPAIEVAAGSGLTGGGTLGSNVTISHDDTSSQASVNNSSDTVIQDVTLDGFGHVTALGSVDLSTFFVPLARTVTAGSGMSGGGALSGNITISHADTSSQASVNNSGSTFVQDITLDTYGHVTGIVSANTSTAFYASGAVITGPNGSAVAPTFSFSSDSNTGIFSEGDGSGLHFAVDGTDRLVLTSGALSLNGNPLVSDTRSISAGGGLSGGGDLSANRTISHGNTSSVASINNSGGTVIQDLTFDSYGHVTAAGSVNLDSRYVVDGGSAGSITLTGGGSTTPALGFNSGIDGLWWQTGAGLMLIENNTLVTEIRNGGTLTNGISVPTRNTGDARWMQQTWTLTAGGGLSGGGNGSTNRTISHGNTSSISNLEGSGGTVLQSINFDTYGHATSRASVNLDSRYFQLDTAWNGVGSTVMAKCTSSAHSAGDTTSGSNLDPSNANGNPEETSMPGTWVCCGLHGTQGDLRSTTNWRRI